jgi:hypothetical protein
MTIPARLFSYAIAFFLGVALTQSWHHFSPVDPTSTMSTSRQPLEDDCDHIFLTDYMPTTILVEPPPVSTCVRIQNNGSIKWFCRSSATATGAVLFHNSRKYLSKADMEEETWQCQREGFLTTQ